MSRETELLAEIASLKAEIEMLAYASRHGKGGTTPLIGKGQMTRAEFESRSPRDRMKIMRSGEVQLVD